MKSTVLISLFVLVIYQAIACECAQTDLNAEIANTENIFIGKVVFVQGDNYKIQILKIWKGQLSFKDSIALKQNQNGCERYLLRENEYHVFFLNRNAVNQCSRTRPYRYSNDVPTLDSIYNESYSINPRDKGTVDSLEYNRKYIIETNAKPIDTKDKKILYYYKNKIIQQGEIPIGGWFYPTRYYLVGEDINSINCEFDYVLLISTEHQEMLVTDESKQKIMEKIKRKACR